jgi:hypothetical protein
MDQTPRPPLQVLIKSVHEYFGVVNDFRTTFLTQYNEESKDLMLFIVTVMGVLGVIAGFGFAAFSSIENQTLFFTGEFLVIGAIIAIIFSSGFFFLSRLASSEGFVNKYMGKGAEIKQALIEKEPDKLAILAQEHEDNITSLSQPPKLNAIKIVGPLLIVIATAISVGIVLVLLSFIG